MNEEQKKETRVMQLMVIWYKNRYCLNHHPHPSMIAHVPNEGQQHLVSIGLLPGFSDLTICHRAHVDLKGLHIYIEVKTPTGTQSPNQKKFQERVESLGFQYHIVRTQEQFQTLIEKIHTEELGKVKSNP